ncbi:MAG: sensor histidine kinase [Acidimicrobiia bacterium]
MSAAALPALDSLRRRWRDEQYASWAAAGGIVIVALVARAPYGVLLGALIGALAMVRLLAFPALDRGDITGAVWWTAGGTWAVAVAVVALMPVAFPVVVLNLAGPLIIGATYLDAAAIRRLLIGGIAASVALAVVGFRSPGVGLRYVLPLWLLHALLIMFLAMHVVMLAASLLRLNQHQLEQLDDALAVNDALRHAEDELQASRRRVLAAADQERVRVERNLHDGAQQRLVALAVQLRLAAQLAREGRNPTPESLDALHAESQEALDELRELAHGIYPSALAERGLMGALRIMAGRSPVPVTVDGTDVELPIDDAAAIYFICAEALQNIAKHAGAANQASLTIGSRDDGTTVRIVDDGPGFDVDATHRSRGLLNMSDRAGALGAHLTIDSSPGSGTEITIAVPRRHHEARP